MKLYRDSSYLNEIEKDGTITVPDFIYARVETSGNEVVQVKVAYLFFVFLKLFSKITTSKAKDSVK